MATSSAVANGDLATAAQYNDLRTDVLSTHNHDGTDGNGIIAATSWTPAAGATINASAAATWTVDLADTNSAVGAWTFYRSTTGTAANGIGSVWDFDLENDAGTQRTAVEFQFVFTTVAASSETSRWTVLLRSSGTFAERLRYSPGAFAFQEATIISTSAGDLDLNPAGQVKIQKTVDIEVSGIGFEQVADGSFLQWQLNNLNSSTGESFLDIQTHGSATGASDPHIKFRRVTASTEDWSIGMDASSSNGFAIGNSANLGTAEDAIRITTASPPVVSFNTTQGADFDYVCDCCGRHEYRMFQCCGEVTWHDDNALIGLLKTRPKEAVERLAMIGVYDLDSDTPGWLGLNIQPAMQFTWAGMWQNRQRMDAQYGELDRRLLAIGA